MKKHLSNGYELVRKQFFINGATAAIAQHHERINGSGYLQGLTGGNRTLPEDLQWLMLTTPCLDRPYPAYPPHKALEILEVENEGFDLPVLQHFYQHIAAYPIGTVVELNDGRVGVVVHNTAGYPTRPKVRILWLAEGFEPVEPVEVDLVQILSLVVDRVIPAEELPEQAIQQKRD